MAAAALDVARVGKTPDSGLRDLTRLRGVG